MNLLMLTKFYPYGTGEAFIENEIKVMADYYDRIIIMACEVPNHEKIMRALPENVQACRVPEVSKRIDGLKGMMRSWIGDNDFKSEKKECKSLLQKIFLSYFEEKSRRIYKYIISEGILDDFVDKPYVLYSYWLFVTARVGILIARDDRPVYLFTRAHGYDLYEGRNKLNYLPYRKLFLKEYNDVFPCSDNGTQHLQQQYPAISHNVHTALLGTLDHGVGQGSDDGIFRIVSCSRVEPVKRVDKIVDALALLDCKRFKIEWVHIGDGSGFLKLKKKADEKLKYIKYMFPGNMKNSDVMKFYAEQPVDLLINVSSSEGLPVSIMEAISFGIPCIGTDVGGTSEIVVNGITGKLIPSDFTAESLAEIIESRISNCDMIADRITCRKYWEDHFQAISNYHEMYRYLKKQQNNLHSGEDQ